MPDYHRIEYEDARQWFAQNLERPTRLSVSRRPHAKAQALSWFKSSSSEHLRQMRRIKALLEDHGIVVEVIQTERPGFVVYEDAFQIVAYPFADTST